MLRMAMQPDNNDSIHNTFAIYNLQNVMIIVGLQLLLFSSLSQFSLLVNLLYVTKNIFIKLRKFTSKNRGHKTAIVYRRGLYTSHGFTIFVFPCNLLVNW